MKIGRRAFLKFAGFAGSAILFFTSGIPLLFGGKWEHDKKDW